MASTSAKMMQTWMLQKKHIFCPSRTNVASILNHSVINKCAKLQNVIIFQSKYGQNKKIESQQIGQKPTFNFCQLLSIESQLSFFFFRLHLQAQHRSEVGGDDLTAPGAAEDHGDLVRKPRGFRKLAVWGVLVGLKRKKTLKHVWTQWFFSWLFTTSWAKISENLWASRFDSNHLGTVETILAHLFCMFSFKKMGWSN